MRRVEHARDPWIEEEVVDAALPLLGWRAEARVRVPVAARGGVLADAVGYGKTAITLALIDAEWRRKAPKLPIRLRGGAIPCRATLVIVPKHLMHQWPAELEKFLGTRYACLAVMTVGDLARLTVADFLDAEIIIMAVQAFRSKTYFERFAAFASVNALPNRGGRYFEEVHAAGVANVERYARILVADGPEALARVQQADRAALDTAVSVNTSKKQAYEAGVPLKGKREAAAPPRATTTAPKVSGIKSSNAASSGAVARVGDWHKLKGPPLELFYFARKVVDEYTYLDARDVPTVQAVKARCAWVLSGTPPLDTFDDVRGIASYLGVHLGAPDPVALTKKGDRPSDARRELSGSELFEAFLETASPAWRTRRRGVAQAFLDRFVRQNVAEIDEIPFAESAVHVALPPAERAVYLELEHHLRALEMRTGKGTARGGGGRRADRRSDRERRLADALDGSRDAEEALLKRCAAPASGSNDALTIVKKRESELADCGAQIAREVAAAHRCEEELRRWCAQKPLTGDRDCENIFAKHGATMWQIGGQPNGRGKSKNATCPVRPLIKPRAISTSANGALSSAPASATQTPTPPSANSQRKASPPRAPTRPTQPARAALRRLRTQPASNRNAAAEPIKTGRVTSRSKPHDATTLSSPSPLHLAKAPVRASSATLSSVSSSGISEIRSTSCARSIRSTLAVSARCVSSPPSRPPSVHRRRAARPSSRAAATAVTSSPFVQPPLVKPALPRAAPRAFGPTRSSRSPRSAPAHQHKVRQIQSTPAPSSKPSRLSSRHSRWTTVSSSSRSSMAS